MKFYIDLDYTMMNTSKFHEARHKMLQSYSITLEKEKEMIDYITKQEKKLINLNYLGIKLSEKYNLPKQELLDKMNKIVDNSYIYLYNDTIEFLEYLKREGHNLYILTFGDKDLQLQKIKGSKIEKYFDDIILTENLKFTIDIDYKNGIFIDDNPRDLEGLYKKNPIDIIRIRRDGGKYSNVPSKIQFKEYKTLRDYQKDISENLLQESRE